ncbi:MAG: hypothetical protein JXA99_01760 [Candidatus Lokiarchaeota archaeon]|nr:hypothetical protein [Candidatus Lokiarchaeota archaeon]
MDELYRNEQYFFDKNIEEILLNFIKLFKNPCLLCAPKLGREILNKGIPCTILDIDKRFSDIAGFQYFDLTKPYWIGANKFGIILCDPPFFNIKLSELFRAIKLLSQYDFSQYLFISYLVRRSKKFLNIFKAFNLKPSGFIPSYKSIEKSEKNKIEFYTNLPDSLIKSLKKLN